MRLLLFTVPMFISCITDSGEIDEACDEVKEPCIWDDTNDTGDADDTGTGFEADA